MAIPRLLSRCRPILHCHPLFAPIVDNKLNVFLDVGGGLDRIRLRGQNCGIGSDDGIRGRGVSSIGDIKDGTKNA